MNVVIYSRVSSQSARQSTERQVVDLERFAAGRRWNESRSAVRGAQSGGETDTGDGDETVNRKN